MYTHISTFERICAHAYCRQRLEPRERTLGVPEGARRQHHRLHPAGGRGGSRPRATRHTPPRASRHAPPTLLPLTRHDEARRRGEGAGRGRPLSLQVASRSRPNASQRSSQHTRHNILGRFLHHERAPAGPPSVPPPSVATSSSNAGAISPRPLATRLGESPGLSANSNPPERWGTSAWGSGAWAPNK
jgi:hypothetical protein